MVPVFLSACKQVSCLKHNDVKNGNRGTNDKHYNGDRIPTAHVHFTPVLLSSRTGHHQPRYIGALEYCIFKRMSTFACWKKFDSLKLTARPWKNGDWETIRLPFGSRVRSLLHQKRWKLCLHPGLWVFMSLVPDFRGTDVYYVVIMYVLNCINVSI